MTAYELAAKLLDGPDLEVLIPDYDSQSCTDVSSVKVEFVANGQRWDGYYQLEISNRATKVQAVCLHTIG